MVTWLMNITVNKNDTAGTNLAVYFPLHYWATIYSHHIHPENKVIQGYRHTQIKQICQYCQPQK